MPKIKKVYQHGFTTVDNTVLNDSTISLKAKGLFVYLWSQSDNWNFYEKEVVKHSTDGISGLRSGIKELESHGYLLRKRERKSGQVKASIWILQDSPKLENLNQVKPTLEKPKYEKPKCENRTLTNTNLNKYQSKQIHNSLSLSERGKKEKNKSVDNSKSVVVDLIDGLFGQWGYKLKPFERAKLQKAILNKPTNMLRDQAIKALSLADDYPFGYMMTLIKNLPDVKEKVANE